MNSKTGKLIVSKTVMFIGVVVFVVLFQEIFGSENVLVGVTTVTAALLFLQRDLTVDIRKYFIGFLVLNIFQGISVYIASNYIFLGVIINFVAIFIVGYLFTYNLRAPMYVAFGLQYIFMWAMPVPLSELSTRLISLAFGAFCIVGVQLIANRGRFKKVSKNTVPMICTALSEKMQCIINKKDLDNIEKIDDSIFKGIKGLRKEVLDRTKELFYMSKEGKVNLNISIALERMAILIDSFKDVDDKYQLDFLEEARQIVMEVSEATVCRENAQKTVEDISNLINKYRDYRGEKYVFYDLLNVLDFLKHALNEIASLSEKEYTKIRRSLAAPKEFSKKEIIKREFNSDSLRFSYALRVSILASIAMFVVNYFNLPDGKWLVFTIFSITQPYTHAALKKSKDRVVGTLIGLVGCAIVFYFVKDKTAIMIIVMVASYINSYIEDYDKQMIFITICALGAAAMTGNAPELILYRAVYVIVGTVIAVIASELILPYSVEKSNRHLIKNYVALQREIMAKAVDAIMGSGNINIVRNLMMQSSLIEDKITVNSTTSPDDDELVEEFLDNERILVSDSYELYLSVNKKSEEMITKSMIKSLIEEVLNCKEHDENEQKKIEKTIKEQINLSVKPKDKLILINLWRINGKIQKSYLMAGELIEQNK